MNVNKEQVEQIKDIRRDAIKKSIEKKDLIEEGAVLFNNKQTNNSDSLLKDVLKKNMKKKSRRQH